MGFTQHHFIVVIVLQWRFFLLNIAQMTIKSRDDTKPTMIRKISLDKKFVAFNSFYTLHNRNEFFFFHGLKIYKKKKSKIIKVQWRRRINLRLSLEWRQQWDRTSFFFYVLLSSIISAVLGYLSIHKSLSVISRGYIS